MAEILVFFIGSAGEILTTAADAITYTATEDYDRLLVVASGWRDVQSSCSITISFTLAQGTSSTLYYQTRNFYNSSGGFRMDVAYNVKAGDTITISRGQLNAGYETIIAF